MNTEVMFSSKTDQWATPQYFYDELNSEFNFTLDPCADDYNHKCGKYFTKEINGLSQSWEGERVFCNPPYGRDIGNWVRKCYEEVLRGCELVVLLIPARTDTRWFHEYIHKKATEIRFIKGRLKFGDAKHPAPFPSMVVIFKRGIDSMAQKQLTAEEKLLNNGYEGVKYLTNYSYDTVLIGVTTDNRAVYDFEKMIGWLMESEEFEDRLEAVEWIEYNTIRAIPYMGEDAPIIIYPLEEVV